MGQEVQWKGKARRDPDELCLHTDMWSGKSPSPPSHPGPGSKGSSSGDSTLTGPTGTSNWASGVGEVNVEGGKKVPQAGSSGSRGLISLSPLIVSVILDWTTLALSQGVLNS